MVTKADFLGMTDHALLRPEMNLQDVISEAKEVAALGVFSVCVKPADVKFVAHHLKDTNTLVGTVVGFPHGNSTIQTKIREGLQAIRDGAVELDIVANFSRFSDTASLIQEVNDIDNFCVTMLEEDHNVLIKVIFETAYLSDEVIKELSQMFNYVPVSFIKTSTGFAGAGATVEHVSIMKANTNIGVKASGGVRTKADVEALVAAGATRLGSSNTASIVAEFDGLDAGELRDY